MAVYRKLAIAIQEPSTMNSDFSRFEQFTRILIIVTRRKFIMIPFHENYFLKLSTSIHEKFSATKFGKVTDHLILRLVIACSKTCTQFQELHSWKCNGFCKKIGLSAVFRWLNTTSKRVPVAKVELRRIEVHGHVRSNVVRKSASK